MPPNEMRFHEPVRDQRRSQGFSGAGEYRLFLGAGRGNNRAYRLFHDPSDALWLSHRGEFRWVS